MVYQESGSWTTMIIVQLGPYVNITRDSQNCHKAIPLNPSAEYEEEAKSYRSKIRTLFFVTNVNILSS